MPRLSPFRALRFASLDAVARRAIDDISAVRDRGRPVRAEDPLHVLRLYAAPDPWVALREWEAAGHLVAENPALYVVEVRPTDSVRHRPAVRYLLGAMGADVPELERAADRLPHPALEPVPVLAADDRHRFGDLLAEAGERAPAAFENTVGAGQVRMWRLEDRQLTRRTLAALDEIAVRPHGEIPARGTFLAAITPLFEPGLRLIPFHRGLRDVPTFSPDRFLTLVSDFARVIDLEAPLTAPGGLDEARAQLATLAGRHRAFLLVLPGGTGKLLRLRQGLELSHIPAAPRSPTLRSLDLALLNALVLRTVIGIHDPEAPNHRQVWPVGTTEELVRQVDEGIFQAGFVLNPPAAWEIRAVMEAAQMLPPRTMRLHPTPPAGLLFLDPDSRER
ncbi:MAG TPA: DUF1015 domain-containing protein [Myxococcaceae bacterium]|nr:DUF1015 domain-containing protein [Myxococcaceae bacterium]